ncbi:hypothetical protein EKK58_05510 [Candidatus Dependentiae bacterium]|nr:MAG: hypothetical protein EKK58_05510 [Candidatus Dependentiae bacterium]
MRKPRFLPIIPGITTPRASSPKLVPIESNDRIRRLAMSSRDERRANAKELNAALEEAAGMRPCDGCTECCTIIGVRSLNKLPGQRCKFVGESGCKTYPNRPQECRQFYCFWRFGYMDDEDRPDKSGIVLNPRQMNDVSFLMVSESRPGAVEKYADKLEDLAAAQGVSIVFGNIAEQTVTRVFGPTSAFFELCMANPHLVGLHIAQRNERGLSWFVAKEARPGTLKYFNDRLRDDAETLGSVVLTGTFNSTEPVDIYGPPDAVAALASLIAERQGIGKPRAIGKA